VKGGNLPPEEGVASMNKGGLGVGSASIILIFAVLSLTIFSLITFVVAQNDIALVQAQSELVVSYYEADSVAEKVLAELLDAGVLPNSVNGVDIGRMWNEERQSESIFFFCRINETKKLFVDVIVEEDTIDILSWSMYNIDEWVCEDRLPVWTGEAVVDE